MMPIFTPGKGKGYHDKPTIVYLGYTKKKRMYAIKHAGRRAVISVSESEFDLDANCPMSS